MSTTYSWEIDSLTHKDVGIGEKIVVSVEASRVATDTDTSIEARLSVPIIEFDELGIDQETHVAFDSLTLAEVVSWVVASISTSELSELESTLDLHLEYAIYDAANPRELGGLHQNEVNTSIMPWA